MEAVEYYDDQRQGLGQEFVEAAWEALGRIEQFPFAWQQLDGHFRQCMLHRFPYGLVYVVVRDEIIVAAVAHLHREPRSWRERLLRAE